MSSASLELTSLRGYAFGRVVKLVAIKDGQSVEMEVSDKMSLNELKIHFENFTGIATSNISAHLTWSKDMEMTPYVKLIEKSNSNEENKDETVNEQPVKRQRHS